MRASPPPLAICPGRVTRLLDPGTRALHQCHFTRRRANASALARVETHEDSTIGGTQRGPEAWLPHIVLDRYTGITLRWAYNEPVINIPFTGFTLTIGRSLLLAALGYAVAAATGNRPFLAAHTALSLFIFFLLRYLVRPVTFADDATTSAAPSAKIDV